MTILDIPWEIARLEGMTVGQLAGVYEEIVGEPARSRHKRYLIRRIAWRMQARAEGDLSERARQRASELADDAQVRVTPPRGKIVTVRPTPPATSTDAPADTRRPAASNWLVRKYKGQTIRVLVLPDGFEFDGERYRSLSAVAKAITGSHVNGYRFFKLGGDA